MFRMFLNNIHFNQDIGNWNVSNVTDMSYMFYQASNFSQNLRNWNVDNVIICEYFSWVNPGLTWPLFTAC